MPTTGDLNPGTAANDNSTGTVAWSNPGNAVSSNNSRSNASMAGGDTSNYLKLTNYNPTAIGDTDTVTQIVAKVERSNSQAGSREVRDSVLRLVIEGTIVGSNLAATATNWPGSDAVATYTFSGLSYTGAQVKAATSGIVLSISAPGGAASPGGEVDVITLDYTYTPNARGPRAQLNRRRRVA